MDGARLLHFYQHCWVSSFLAAAPERAQSDIPSAAKWMTLFLISHTMVPGASELRPAQSRASSSALRQRIFVWLPRLRSSRINSALRSGKHMHPAVRRMIAPPLLPRATTCYQNCIFALRIWTLPSQKSFFSFRSVDCASASRRARAAFFCCPGRFGFREGLSGFRSQEKQCFHSRHKFHTARSGFATNLLPLQFIPSDMVARSRCGSPGKR